MADWSVGPAGALELAAGLVAGGLLGRGALRLRGSTLLAPAIWSAASTLTWTFVRGLPFVCDVGQTVQYGAASLLLCPTIALLGAKRPQHLAWQWVVAALWVTLLAPAAHAAITGADIELHAAWGLLIWGVWGMGLANYLPTRHAPAALLGAAAQLSAVSLYLPGLAAWRWEGSAGVAAVLLLAACAFAHMSAARRLRPGWTGIWIDFRNEFGAVWGLRASQRFNDAAVRADWPLRLSWFGFSDLEGTLVDNPPLSEPQAESLRGVLRRFVSEAWLAKRLPGPGDNPPAECDSDR